jgi:hypothetical protein
MSSAGQQWIRAAQLLLTNQSEALDLSNMRFKFNIEASDGETPNTARVRVYNLSDQTTKRAIDEYSKVVIGAGYGDNPATIFNGTVKQFRQGKERNIDSFLDIYASDGDVAYNFATVSAQLPAGSTPQDELKTLANAMNLPVDPNAPSYLAGGANASPNISTGGILPRGKVLFGLARSYMRDLANSNQVRWSIQNGVITLIPLTGYLPGEAVVLNSATGLVGVPEATNQGISITCLLNPKLRVGGTVQLNNKDITRSAINLQFFPGYHLTQIATVPSTTDGTYRIIVIEYVGDTRDVDWYCNLVCLNIDPSSPANNSVLPYGIPK